MQPLSSLFPLLLAAVAALVFSSNEANASNTNTCLQLLGNLNAKCPQNQLIPSLQCCLAVSEFNKAGCFCNPTISTLAGASNVNLINNVVRPACAVLAVNPLWWIPIKVNRATWKRVSCAPFATKTYNGGTCEMNDMQLDNARISASIGVSTAIQAVIVGTQNDQCFDFNNFLNSLKVFLDPVPTVTVGYGIGSYTDLASAVEYLALASPAVNKDFWRFVTINPDPAQTLYVAPGGSTIILGATGGGQWWRACNSGAQGYMEQNIVFEGCNTVIKTYYVPGASSLTGQPTNLNNFVNKFYLAQRTKTWGIENICRYHEEYCTGSNQQFSDYNECMRFMGALPEVSPQCGNGLILSGNSTTCRFKHSFMIPFDPAAHCFHIGYGNHPDKNGKFKCNDDVECVPTNPAYSDPSVLSLDASDSDAACIAQDVASYATWQPPTNICPGSIVGRRRILRTQH